MEVTSERDAATEGSFAILFAACCLRMGSTSGGVSKMALIGIPLGIPKREYGYPRGWFQKVTHTDHRDP